MIVKDKKTIVMILIVKETVIILNSDDSYCKRQQ